MQHLLFAASAAVIIATTSIGLDAQAPPKAPQFEVDPNWPHIPNNWVLGEVTSISVDRNDHTRVLRVPQSIPEAQRANAAPPVLEFDTAGKLLTSWGGPSTSTVWPGRGSSAGEFDIVHHMAADSKGNLYTAEIVNNRRAQRFVLQKK